MQNSLSASGIADEKKTRAWTDAIASKITSPRKRKNAESDIRQDGETTSKIIPVSDENGAAIQFASTSDDDRGLRETCVWKDLDKTIVNSSLIGIDMTQSSGPSTHSVQLPISGSHPLQPMHDLLNDLTADWLKESRSWSTVLSKVEHSEIMNPVHLDELISATHQLEQKLLSEKDQLKQRLGVLASLLSDNTASRSRDH